MGDMHAMLQLVVGLELFRNKGNEIGSNWEKDNSQSLCHSKQIVKPYTFCSAWDKAEQ